MINVPAIQQSARQAWVIGLYKSLLTLLFLTTAYRELPDYKLIVTLAVFLLFLTGAGLATNIYILSLAANAAADAAERKTRHTVLLARDWPHDEWAAGDIEFWAEVDRRVAREMGDAPKGPPWWKTGALVVAGIANRIFWDLCMVALAFLLSGTTP